MSIMKQPTKAVVKCINCQIAMKYLNGRGWQCGFCHRIVEPAPELPGLPPEAVAQDSMVTRQMTPVAAAMEAFDAYASMDTPELPEDAMARLQVELCRWEAREFGGGNSNDSVLGSNEETGEGAEAMIMLLGAQTGAGRMAKVILKRNQGIRGYDDPEKFRNDLGDAFADMMIFGIQACTKSRMDFWTLLLRTAEDVMGRKWSENKIDGQTIKARRASNPCDDCGAEMGFSPTCHPCEERMKHAGACDSSLPLGDCSQCAESLQAALLSR